jgi:glycosyltransferase involved in cell wall biosynthesis
LARLAQKKSHVEVTGYVDDPTRYLEETAAFIIPLLSGGGMRVKLLDAWSWGLPTVTTSIGAEGIQIESGENVLVGDTPEQFAESLVRLLNEPELSEKLVQGGLHTVQSKYDWQSAYSAWDDIYPCEYCSSLHTRPA